jgi:competence protein ComEC
MKKLFDFVPTHLLVFFVVGILCQYHFKDLFSINFLFVSVVLLGGFFFFFKRLVLGIGVAFFFLGLLSIAIRTPPKKEAVPIDSTLSAPIVLKVIDRLKSNADHDRFRAKRIFQGGQCANAMLLLAIVKDSLGSSIHHGDLLACHGEIKEIRGPLNPYAFNFKSYMQSQQISHQLFLKKGHWILLDENKYNLKRMAHQFRSNLLHVLSKNIADKEVLSITEAMLLGERSHISKMQQQAFADAGVVHILAVSGLHVGLLLLFLNFLLKPLELLPKGRFWKTAVLFSALWSYAFLAGLSPSIVRAVTMFSFLSVGLVFRHKNPVERTLVSSALLLLIFNPFYLFDLGFQMSYTAVFSIVFIQPIFARLWKPKRRILNYFWQLTTVSLAAQLGLLPISLYYFHQFPGLFLLANLGVIPLLGLVLAFGFLLLFLGAIHFLPPWICDFYSFLIVSLNSFVSWVAAQDAFVFDEISFSRGKLLFSLLLLAAFFAFLKSKTFSKLAVFLLCISLLQGVFIFEKIKTSSRSELIVFQQYKESSLLLVNRGKGVLHTTNSKRISKLAQNYLRETGVEILQTKDSIPQLFRFGSLSFLLIDRLGIYQIQDFQKQCVWLQNSPNINLERMIELLRPKQILADGSNSLFKIKKWQATCLQKEVSFHATPISGAFVWRPPMLLATPMSRY